MSIRATRNGSQHRAIKRDVAVENVYTNRSTFAFSMARVVAYVVGDDAATSVNTFREVARALRREVCTKRAAVHAR